MKVIVKGNWTFEEAYERAWAAYRGSGITSRGHRNSVLMTWGNVVGRDRALSELNSLVRKHGGKKGLAEVLGISTSALRKIEQHFEALPAAFESGPHELDIVLERGSMVDLEEDIEHEFKQVPPGIGDPVASLVGKAEEYTVAFMNGHGGRVLWGVTDTGVVEGIALTREQRDEIRKQIASKLRGIQPPIDPSVARLHFHGVVESGAELLDHYVVELGIPGSANGRLHFTSANNAYVRLEGVNQKLVGPAIQEWIDRRRPNGT